MKRGRLYSAVAVWSAVLFALVPNVCAQQAMAPKHIGSPQDWSQRQIIFSRDALLQHPDVIYKEPRVLHQAIQRWLGRYSTIVPGVDTAQIPTTSSSSQLDWSVDLLSRISPNMFPSKFSFDLTAPPSCQNDFVVFGLDGTRTPGATGGGANLVAFNNLYAGTGGICTVGPTVLFAYNITTVTGGHIVTSPVLSLDGKKIAFVESVPAPTPSAIFHVLTWTGGQGEINNAAAPTMTSLPFALANNSTTSSPWVDYASDTAYMGADDGKMYKITGVFKGTPTLVRGAWPVSVATNRHLTPPVLDARQGLLMFGADNGNLYQINAATGILATPLTIGAGTDHGIRGAPIVDVTNGTTFVVTSNDGNGGVLVEADTATLTELARARIGLASKSGTAVDLFQPAFSDSYFTNGPSTGVVRLCGTGQADITPFQYAFGFSGRIMQTATPVFSQQLLTSTAARCTGWTEVFNPTVGVGGTDFFFFGLTADCTAPGNGATDGCVVSRSSDTVLTKVTIAGGPSGIVVDNISTAGQASSIYLMSKNVSTAFKLKQTLGP